MAQIRFTKDHEWVALEGAIATVGITEHAQETLGDIVFVELPEPGRSVEAGEACAVVESVKAASDVYAPLAGDVIEANPALAEEPGLVNQAAEAGGWFFRMRLEGAEAFDALMDADAYRAFVADQG